MSSTLGTALPEPDLPAPLKKTCCICQKNFLNKSNLRRHTKLSHPSVIEKQSYAYSCNLCTYGCNTPKYFEHHKQTKHLVTLKRLPNSKKTHKCPKCVEQFYPEGMESHLQDAHEIRLDIQHLQFRSFHDFDCWKSSIEKTSKSWFVKSSSKKRSKSTSYHYYRCNRSGKYSPKGVGVRQLKTQGSSKIQAYCPASIKLNQNNGRYH